jgi:aminoglycoside/choline kinase family phosphotransferase
MATGTALGAEAASALVRQYLEERQPQLAAAVEVRPLSGDASTRRYYRLAAPGRSVVLALYPEPFAPAELSYLTVHALFEAYALPVPATEDVDGGRGVVLQQDLGDRTLQEALREGAPESRRDALYREAVDEIAQLQLRAAAGPQKADCFRIAFDIEKLSWELHYFLKHFVEGLTGADLSVEDRAVLSESFHQLSREIASWPRVLCHRDYHSRNLMLHDERLYWIDFQDARMGPATYDLASLLRDAYVTLPEDFIAERAEEFRTLALSGVARATFARRFDWTCVQRNLKALGTFGCMTAVRGKDVYLRYVAPTLRHVRRNLGRHAEFDGLRRVLARHIEELT